MKRGDCSLRPMLCAPLRHEAGLTLLELLVSLVIIALLVPLVFGGFRFAVKVANRTDAVGRADEVSQIRGFLRRELSAAYPAFLGKSGEPQIDFSGTQQRLAFLAPTPDAAGGIARSRYVLRFVSASTGGQLVMAWRPVFGGSRMLDVSGLSSDAVLLNDVRAVRFAYFGRASARDKLRWHHSWQNRRHLPALIRLHVVFARGDRRYWPDLVVAPMIAVASPCHYDLVSERCRRSSR